VTETATVQVFVAFLLQQISCQYHQKLAYGVFCPLLNSSYEEHDVNYLWKGASGKGFGTKNNFSGYLEV